MKQSPETKARALIPGLIELVKRFRLIEQQQADLDFRRSRWAKDARGCWTPGESGDSRFQSWCVSDLGVTAFGAAELLARAAVAAIVPDSTTWNRLGGYKALRALEILSRKDQVAVIEAAKVECKAVRTIMRERGLGQPVIALAPKVEAPKVKPGFADDIAKLANYLAQNERKLPEEIRVIVQMYKTVGAPRRTTTRPVQHATIGR